MTGKLVQVIEGQDMRLMKSNGGPITGDDGDDPVLVAMRGDNNDREGTFSKVVELVETREIGMSQAPISPRAPASASVNANAAAQAAIWDEWDM